MNKLFEENIITKYAEIVLPVAVLQLFTYHIPYELENSVQVGVRVVVQFGKRKIYSGVVRKLHGKKPAHYETKPIETVLDEKPLINELHFKFWEWLASYYMCTLGEVYKAALPAGLKLESQTQVFLQKKFNSEIKLTQKQQIIISALQNDKKLSISQINNLIKSKNSLNIVNNLLKKNIIKVRETIHSTYKPKTIKYVKLSDKIQSEYNLQIAFDKISNASKQTAIMLLYSDLSKLHFVKNKFEYKEVKKTDLLKKANASSSIFNSLIEKEILIEFEKETDRIENNQYKIQEKKILSEVQQIAYDEINEKFNTKNIVLLHGVTSSGKTEIYIRLIQEVIDKGKQVLYLLPEIALTIQIVNRLKSIFGDKVGVYHSKFNDAERVEIWNKVYKDELSNSQYSVILGVRSSIFLPYENLGLIIIDEEHEITYKQFNPAPRYHARDSAIVLANLHGAKVLLGTATPSIETYYNTVVDKFALVELKQRHLNIKLPEIIFADIKQAGKKKQMKSIFHPILLNNIEAALQKKEQIILFQNRRGFSSFLECKTCSWIPKCEHCDVSLTYHKMDNDLVCHYCGYRIRVPNTCLACGDGALETRGFGTQQIEEEIKIFFPNITVQRMDLDTIRSKTGYEKIISKFENHKIDILMVLKWYPKV